LKLYDSAWFISYEITRKTPGEVKILVRDSIPFPFLDRDEQGFVICLPNLRKLGGKTVEYQGMIFDLEDETHDQIIWSLFKSSVYYLSLYIVASNVKVYSECVKGKDKEIALNAINLIEDAVINAYIKAFHKTLLPEITFANALSYLLLKPAGFIRNEGVRFASSILSCYKTGMIKGKISERMLRDTKDVVGMLRGLEDETVKAYLDSENQSDDEEESLTVKAEEKARVFSEIYERLSNYSNSFPEVPSFLYMNHPTRNSIFYSETDAPAEDEINRVMEEITHRLNLKIDFNLNAMKSEAAQALWDWAAKEKKKEKILNKYKVLGEGTRFKRFLFPKEDYAEFLRRKEKHSKTIRRIANRLAVYYNLTGDDFRRETGVIDLQQAIQVVASQSQRSDIFMEDTLRDRGQSWAILVDVSLSLRNFAGDVKDVLLCLSETSRKLRFPFPLGIFAFDDKFYVVKDFAEGHARSICARIGGIEHSGMTYLSDGLKVAAEALKKQREEQKILIAVSDGFPTGYRNAVEETKEQIKRILRSGIHMIGMGIASERIKEFFPVNCVVASPFHLMRSFVDTFFQLTSMM